MKHKNIAIDGPSGAGKSTFAKKLAEHFGFIYVDTGAMYRCVGLYVFRKGVPSDDAEAVSALLNEIDIDIKYDGNGVQRMYLNGEDVTDAIRTIPEVSKYASEVSALPAVRAFLLETQRRAARENNVVMDGRDIGTVILPDAQLKIYLTASAEARALRRFKELREKGVDCDYVTVLSDMTERDRNDMTREISPLRQADDAILVDTSGLNLEESFDLLKKLTEERFGI